jgi:hypothetical protein
MIIASYRPLSTAISFGATQKLERFVGQIDAQQIQALQNLGYLSPDQANVLIDHLVPDANGNTLGSGALATKYGI